MRINGSCNIQGRIQDWSGEGGGLDYFSLHIYYSIHFDFVLLHMLTEELKFALL